MSQRLSGTDLSGTYDVFKAGDLVGGKRVMVFADAAGDLQARAAQAGVALSVFIEQSSMGSLHLRVFTPTHAKGESDSASVAALVHCQGQLADVAEVITGTQTTPAQLCGGEWLLQQGVVQAHASDIKTSVAGARQVHVSWVNRPNLLVELASLAELDAFKPDAQSIAELGQVSQTTGLILYTLEQPKNGPQCRAEVCFRAFGPLKGFLEDAASSNMFACLTGVLAQRGLLPADGNIIRGAQRMPGQPARLTAQYGAASEAIWVGGQAVPVALPLSQ